MTPDDVINLHADLLHRMDHDDAITRGILEVIADQKGYERTRPDDTAATIVLGASRIAVAMLNHMHGARYYHVTADMVDLAAFAAKGLDDLDHWTVTAPPAGVGWCVLDRALAVHDAAGNGVLIHAFSWGPVALSGDMRGRPTGTPATLFAFWADMDRVPRGYDPGHSGMVPRAEFDTVVRPLTGRWHFIGCESVPDQMRIGPSELPPIAEYLDGQEQVLKLIDSPTPFTNVARFLLALFLLMEQTVTDVREAVPSRAAAKRARRANLPQRVTVITLRRAKRPEHHDGETQREWSCRWIVNGYWRWQRYGPGNSLAKRIWIHDFVKGPEDKPLRVPSKVYDLRR